MDVRKKCHLLSSSSMATVAMGRLMDTATLDVVKEATAVKYSPGGSTFASSTMGTVNDCSLEPGANVTNRVVEL